MDDNIRVSIIIPVYNAQTSIGKCLDAIHGSSYKNFETILIDDNSTDNSGKISKEFPCKIIRLEQTGGAASARNRGAAQAMGEILFFTDADVLIKRDTIKKIVDTFIKKPEISAVIGSYTKEAVFKNFISVYKNIIHHYTHQISSENAYSFWTGCGAIKKDIFEEIHGFDSRFKKSSVEDIELGYRLLKRGYKIFLNKEIQVTHFKKYTLFGLIKSDLFCRSIPWTKLMLKYKAFKNDQDTKINNILSIIISYLLIFAICIHITGLIYIEIFIPIILLLILSFLMVNFRLFKFVVQNKGLWFAIKFILMNCFTNLYSGLGFIVGCIYYLIRK